MTGKIWKYGDNIDTDLIIPARHLVSTDPAVLAAHCMEDLDAAFVAGVRPGDMVVAGENFGCGSSREHAPLALKGAGIACVIARSFARIFYRNAMNVGLPILECPDTDQWRAGDILEADMGSGRIVHCATGKMHHALPIPPFMQELLADGGLIPHLMKQTQRPS